MAGETPQNTRQDSLQPDMGALRSTEKGAGWHVAPYGDMVWLGECFGLLNATKKNKGTLL